ncbi:MAG: TonB-dependent receptor [Lentisphaerae bacterium]|nr:TonB-dependent receptor [Lentisphaerota bacterium]
MRSSIVWVLGAWLALANVSLAEIVVSAGRVPMASEDVASSVTSISGAELERLQVTTLPEAVRLVPGVHVVRNGGPGQTASLYIRGAKPEHVLYLIDGMEVNDPSLIGRSGDLTLLDVADIDHVEVLRGPQSAVYGSDAMGGVVNVITRKGKGAPQVNLTAEAGSFETYRESLAVSGGTGIVDYAFTATRVDSEGISAANEADGNTEKDGFDRTGLSGRFGITPSENLSFDFVARYSKDSVEYDDGAGAGGDALDNVADSERFFFGGSAKLGLLDSQWQQRLSASTTSHRRDFMSTWGANWFDSSLLKAGWQHDLYYKDMNVLSAGVEIEQETAETDSLPEVDSDIKSLFAEDRLHMGDLVLVAGIRLDDHDTFGDEVTGRVGATLKLDEIGMRLKSSYGTGFKAPSLYQLYAPASAFGVIGNAELMPETSTSWDAGIEQRLADDRVTVGVTYFDSEYEDLIDFVDGYVNQSVATIRGVECSARMDLCEDLSIGGSYTYTDSEGEAGKKLSRRPRHRASADIAYRCGDDITLSLTGIYVGEREDAYYSLTEFMTVSEDLPSYVVVDLAASWRLCENMTLFGRVENLFDEEYEELSGFGTPGISGYGGVRITL